MLKSFVGPEATVRPPATRPPTTASAASFTKMAPNTPRLP